MSEPVRKWTVLRYFGEGALKAVVSRWPGHCTIAHPTWMVVVSLMLFIPFAYLGALVVRKKPTS